jgi:hypothetical protein
MPIGQASRTILPIHCLSLLLDALRVFDCFAACHSQPGQIDVCPSTACRWKQPLMAYVYASSHSNYYKMYRYVCFYPLHFRQILNRQANRSKGRTSLHLQWLLAHLKNTEIWKQSHFDSNTSQHQSGYSQALRLLPKESIATSAQRVQS